MGVGIDQPGDEQPVGRVDAAGVVADALARRQHRNDGVVFDQDIGMLTAEPPGGENTAAMNQLFHVATAARHWCPRFRSSP